MIFSLSERRGGAGGVRVRASESASGSVHHLSLETCNSESSTPQSTRTKKVILCCLVGVQSGVVLSSLLPKIVRIFLGQRREGDWGP